VAGIAGNDPNNQKNNNLNAFDTTLFLEWWNNNKTNLVNQSMKFSGIYSSYLSFFVGTRQNFKKIPRNFFKHYWDFICSKEEYSFEISRSKGITIYHTYESRILAKK
jgi:hypothetical protein